MTTMMTTIACPKCNENFESLDDLWNHVPGCKANQDALAQQAKQAEQAKSPEPACICKCNACGFTTSNPMHIACHTARCTGEAGAPAPASVATTSDTVKPQAGAPAPAPVAKKPKVMTIDEMKAALATISADFKPKHQLMEAEAKRLYNEKEAKEAEQKAAAGGKATTAKPPRAGPYAKPAAASKSAAKPPPSALQTQFKKGGSTYRAELKKLKEEHGKPTKTPPGDAEALRKNTLDVILQVKADDVNKFVAKQGESGSLGALPFLEFVEKRKNPEQLAIITSLAEADIVGFFRGVDAITNQLSSKRRSEAKKLAAPEGGAPAASPSPDPEAPPAISRVDTDTSVKAEAVHYFNANPHLVQSGFDAAYQSLACSFGLHGAAKAQLFKEVIKQAYAEVFVLQPDSASAKPSTISAPVSPAPEPVDEPVDAERISLFVIKYVSAIPKHQVQYCTYGAVKQAVSIEFRMDEEALKPFSDLIKRTADDVLLPKKGKGAPAPRKGVVVAKKTAKAQRQAKEPKEKKQAKSYGLFVQQYNQEALKLLGLLPEPLSKAMRFKMASKILSQKWKSLEPGVKDDYKEGKTHDGLMKFEDDAKALAFVKKVYASATSPAQGGAAGTPSTASSASEDGHDEGLSALAMLELDYMSDESQ